MHLITCADRHHKMFETCSCEPLRFYPGTQKDSSFISIILRFSGFIPRAHLVSSSVKPGHKTQDITLKTTSRDERDSFIMVFVHNMDN